MLLHVLSLLLALLAGIRCQIMTPDTCPAPTGHFAITEAEADVVIGAVLNVRLPGEGVLGCGPPTDEGIQIFESLRWAIRILNQDKGTLNDIPIRESFIPGIKFGLQTYDSCSHSELAVKYMTELFPVMKSGQQICDSIEQNSTRIIGMVDSTNVNNIPRVAETIKKFVIPVIPLSEETLVPPEQLAKVLAEVVHDLDWEKVAILHADDEYSIFVTKVFGQISFSGYPCIVGIKSFPSTQTKEGDEQTVHKIVNSLTSKLSEKSAVIVIGHGKMLTPVLDIINKSPHLIKLQWLFSWMPTVENFSELVRISNSNNIYSLSPYPKEIHEFEDYWARLQDLAFVSNTNDHWFLEYAMNKKGCRVSGYQNNIYNNFILCENLVIEESSTDGLKRTSRFLPAFHAVLSFAHAYRRAWAEKCLEVPGMCTDLALMTRREFVETYLEPLEFKHNSQFRSPVGVTGQKTATSARGEIEGLNLALNVYSFMPNHGLSFRQVLAYDSQEAKVLDEAFRYQPSVCPKGGCSNCISVRQSRFDKSDNDISANEDFVTIARTEDFVIPILLPIHEAGKGPMECGDKINPEAVKNLEAALWTIDQINADPEYLPNVHLGAVVIDTCSSPLKLTQRVTSFLMELEKKGLDDLSSALAFIASGSSSEVSAAVSLVSPLNMTLVSQTDSIRVKYMRKNLLQIPVPLETQMQAVADTLKFFGWDFVSVVYDKHGQNTEFFEAFKKSASSSDVCLALELLISNIDDIEADYAVAQIIAAKDRGSNALILWTSEITTTALLKALKRAVLAKAISDTNLIIIFNGKWINDFKSFEGFENETIGSLIFKSEHGEVRDFTAFYQRLLPETNKRNVWFSELWNMNNKNCIGNSCELKVKDSLTVTGYSSSTWDMIQAVLVISAGLAKLRHDMCSPEPGLCLRMLQQPYLRDMLHKYIHETASNRLDVKNEMFTFTKDGYGNIPISIFSFKRGVKNSFIYQKVGTYHNYQTDLVSTTAYTVSGKDVVLDKISSTCVNKCSSCGRKTTDFLVLESPDHIYLSAAMAIHMSGSNPLSCGQIDSNLGIQGLESFLWALDEINASPQILPGVTLGAVVFDSCNSKEKAARDVSNFLSNSLSSKLMPSINQVLGFVSTQNDNNVQSITDVTMPFKMLTIATRVTSTKYNDAVQYPYLFRTSLPNNVVADSIVNLLKHFRWNFVSVVYSISVPNLVDLYEIFHEKAEKENIQLARVEKMSSDSELFVNGILQRLKSKQEEGSRVVILFLNANDMSSLFSTFSKQWVSDSKNFLWIGIDNVEMFHTYADVSLGALMVRANAPTVMPFKYYFENLNLKNNSRNPWFREYWEQMFKCHGISCYNDSLKNRMPFLQNPIVPSIINSVLSIGVALEALRQQLCPEQDRGMCSALKGDPFIRDLLFNISKESSFMGVDGKLFKFTNQNYAARNLEVYNFRQVGSNAKAFVIAGNYSPDEGLALNYSRLKSYDENGKEHTMYDIKSNCNNSESCLSSDSQNLVSFMQIIPQQQFAISAVMPIHQKSDTFFSCGKLKDESMMQNLAAISYALEKINTNVNILPGIELGALIFDYCGRKQRAEEMIYSFFSNKMQNKSKIVPRSIIGTMTYGEDVATHLSPIFEAANVVQIAAPSKQNNMNEEAEDILHTVPSVLSQIQVLLSISRYFNWEFINLVYSNTDFGRSGYYHFSKGAKDTNICISKVILVESNSLLEDIKLKFERDFNSNSAKVVIVLVDDSEIMSKIMESIKMSSVLQKFVWLTSESLEINYTLINSINNPGIDLITVKMENKKDSKFENYFLNMTPRKHGPIPSEWFDEFWQHHFHCQLPNSAVAQKQHTTICSGYEHLNFENLPQDKYVYHTIKVIESIAMVLHEYLIKKCPYGLAATSVDDCGENARTDLKLQIEKTLSKKDPECEECGPPGSLFGYEIYQTAYVNYTNTYRKIGDWKDGLLTINNTQLMFTSRNIPESVCKIDCYQCANQLGRVETLLFVEESIYSNFKEVWGITVAAMSVFGMILVIICALYFLMSFPVTVGTTILGYMILFGLLLLYSVNFAFVISPTAVTCGIRRFGLGLAYAVIFAGMLVKVMNTWRLMGYNGSRMLNDGTRLSSPTGLLVIAVGLVVIQIVLSAAWLILIPPKIGAYEMGWRCAPPTTFEEGLVVSLVYVMLLLAITTLFAILTWQCQDNNRESRWILTCSTLVAAVWLAWTVLSTQLSPHHRDMTIAAANLVNATIIMVCLYLRKVYLYSKLTRQAAMDQDIKTHLQPSTYSHSLYGSSVKSGPFSTLAPVLYGSQASLNGKKLYTGPSSRLELINCPEDNKSDSSGSVQVQAADLYPLDMYDGGSQFQPVNSLYGSNHTLVLDDTITFGR